MNEIPATYTWLTDTQYAHLYPKMLLQVKKDFELTGLTIDISESTTPEELIKEVSYELYQLIQYKFDVFMQLLYRIDIAEQLMKSDEVESAEVLTEKATYQVLKREWQKVELRERFSK
jgi:hypothetical protein